jgi:hypothetical protein
VQIYKEEFMKIGKVMMLNNHHIHFPVSIEWLVDGKVIYDEVLKPISQLVIICGQTSRADTWISGNRKTQKNFDHAHMIIPLVQAQLKPQIVGGLFMLGKMNITDLVNALDSFKQHSLFTVVAEYCYLTKQERNQHICVVRQYRAAREYLLRSKEEYEDLF